MLDSLLQSDAHVCTAGQRYGLDRSGTPLTLGGAPEWQWPL